MGDKEKVVTTFYFQTFVWYPSKKEKAEFPRKFTLQEIKQQLWQGAKMSCQAKLASLPLSEKYMFKIGWGIAYKPFLLWLLVKGSTLQMPAKCALCAPCPWEWQRGRHRSFPKVRQAHRGTDGENQHFLPKKNQKPPQEKNNIYPQDYIEIGRWFFNFQMCAGVFRLSPFLTLLRSGCWNSTSLHIHPP